MAREIKVIVGILLALYAGQAVFAGEWETQQGTCYFMADGKPQQQHQCKLSSGYGAGGTYVSAEIGRQTINTEIQTCYDKKTDRDVECGATLNDAEAKHFYRDAAFKPITDPKRINNKSLSCYRTLDRKQEFCFK